MQEPYTTSGKRAHQKEVLYSRSSWEQLEENVINKQSSRETVITE